MHGPIRSGFEQKCRVVSLHPIGFAGDKGAYAPVQKSVSAPSVVGGRSVSEGYEMPLQQLYHYHRRASIQAEWRLANKMREPIRWLFDEDGLRMPAAMTMVL